MLQNRLTMPLSNAEQQDAMHLLNNLSCLPLAVVQAAACNGRQSPPSQPGVSYRAAPQRLRPARGRRLSAEGPGKLWPCHRSPAQLPLWSSPCGRGHSNYVPVLRGRGQSSEAQIRQRGSRQSGTHVTGGSVFQGNFVGLTFNFTTAA
ncbi:hypothetical protein M3J09_001374 [Ascochyta lentis]